VRRGSAQARGRWHLRCIQSKAFCCFKQYRFVEALALFKEQERLMGPSAPLCENIGHVASSLSDYDEAERNFRLATKLLPPSAANSKNAGGVYLGLGLLLDRRGKPSEALPVLQQALELYEVR
jgi:tetratricopeptide (TPR) repeat protein